MTHQSIPMNTPHLNLPMNPLTALNRRSFLKTTGWACLSGSAMMIGGPARAASPNHRLNHACIGVGGMGENDLRNFLEHPRTQVVAVCDVDARHLSRARELAPGARAYSDWRELLEKEGDSIDSVNVTVPDHMHFPIAVSALRRGKHVYCQKPMCHDVVEVRALTQAAQAAGVITQLGTQIASSVGERMAVHYLRQGHIGKIKQVVLCANRPGAIEDYRLPGPRPERGEEPPSQLNWDLWLGTAPWRPFAPNIYHPTRWRAWQDFGTGWSGDIGCHLFDAVWRSLDLTAPTSVTARVQESWRDSPIRRADTWPQSNHITWIFPGNERTDKSDLQIDWYDGLFLPPEDIRSMYPGENYPTESALFIGTEGALMYPLGAGPLLLPRDRFSGVERPDFQPRNHYHHFADACLGGEMTECHFAQSGAMTEAILLGTVAVRTPGVLLNWDPAGLKLSGHAEAEHFLRRHYREGWQV